MHDGTWGRVGCLLAPHRVRVSHLRDVTYLGRLPEVGPQSSQLHRKIKTFSSSCLLALPRFTVNQRSACQPETSRGLIDGQVLTDVTFHLYVTACHQRHAHLVMRTTSLPVTDSPIFLNVKCEDKTHFCLSSQACMSRVIKLVSTV